MASIRETLILLQAGFTREEILSMENPHPQTVQDPQTVPDPQPQPQTQTVPDPQPQVQPQPQPQAVPDSQPQGQEELLRQILAAVQSGNRQTAQQPTVSPLTGDQVLAQILRPTTASPAI